jgi:hypothetical protein
MGAGTRHKGTSVGGGTEGAVRAPWEGARGGVGVLSLVAPIPPATISFHGTAVVHPAASQARVPVA